MDRTRRIRGAVARRRGDNPLFVARGADRQRRNAGRAVVERQYGEAELFLLLAVLLWIMHRANIARLIAGTEGKIGAKSER